jgi:hypothetical protein
MFVIPMTSMVSNSSVFGMIQVLSVPGIWLPGQASGTVRFVIGGQDMVAAVTSLSFLI